MKKGTMVARMLGMVTIVALIIAGLTPALIPDSTEFEYDVTRKIKGFYEEPEDSLDLIFIGSSNLFSTINPAVLWEEQGITSYVFAANEQNLGLSYYYIKEALKYQHPQAIVLDMYYCNFGRMQREGVTRLNLGDLRWSWNKVEAIWNNVPADLRLSYFFPIIKYHQRWSALTLEDFAGYSSRNPYKGWSPFETEESNFTKTPEDIAANPERIELDGDAVEWLNKIMAYCDEQDVELIFLKTPNEDKICLPIEGDGYEEVTGQPYYNTIADMAGERGISFINYNVIMKGTGHNDVLNSQRVTSHFGKWYVETHDVEDKRGLEEYSYWEEDAEEAYEYIAKAKKVK